MNEQYKKQGDGSCGCGCEYTNQEGSSIVSNGLANAEKGVYSSGEIKWYMPAPAVIVYETEAPLD